MDANPARKSRASEQRVRLEKLLDQERLLRLQSAQRRKAELEDDSEIDTRSANPTSRAQKENDADLYQTHGRGGQSDVLDASGMETISHRCAILEDDVGRQPDFESMSKELQENQRRCFASLGVGFVQLWHSTNEFCELGICRNVVQQR